ncbi:MAG: O-antigen ligase family protein [Chlamydiota bacterium]
MNAIKICFFSCTLGLFALFLSLGNLFRLIESSLFSDSLMISEAILYMSACISAFFLRSYTKWLLAISPCVLAILCSFLYGWHLHGWDVHAILYALRLIALLATMSVLAEICFERYKGSVRSFFSYLCKAYGFSLFLGFILYFFFPDSEKLWLWLGQYHVGFQGDPHIGRFVSVYFDPNYYSCIAGLAFLLSSYLYEMTKKRRYQLLSFLFLLSGLLTWSRSGLALLAMVLGFKGLVFFKSGKVTQKGIFLTGFFLLFLCLYVGIYFEEIAIFWERTFYFFEDDSALCRLRTFQFGLDLLSQYPLFGVGINFLYRYAIEGIGLNSIDSSLLSLLIQIGVIPFLLLIMYGSYKALSLQKVFRLWKKKEEKNSYFFSWFLFYGVSVVLFSSQFNNLLFYPFWLLPFGVIAIFLVKRAQMEDYV